MPPETEITISPAAGVGGTGDPIANAAGVSEDAAAAEAAAAIAAAEAAEAAAAAEGAEKALKDQELARLREDIAREIAELEARRAADIKRLEEMATGLATTAQELGVRIDQLEVDEEEVPTVVISPPQAPPPAGASGESPPDQGKRSRWIR